MCGTVLREVVLDNAGITDVGGWEAELSETRQSASNDTKTRILHPPTLMLFER